MKHTKRLLPIILSLIMVTDCIAGTDLTAYANIASDGNFHYDIIEQGARIYKYRHKDSGGYVTIPASFDGHKVIGIFPNAFENCSNIKGVTIPNSVSYIGNSAFQNCTSLQSVSLPNSITSLGNYVFANCTNLSSIKIPNSVTYIGGAFVNCTSLNSVTLSNQVHTLSSSFSGCSNLYHINIPNSVKKIVGSCFKDCISLRNLTLPNSVTEIGNRAFSGCTSLTQINLPNNLSSIGEYAFHNCVSLRDAKFSNNITSIGANAFNGCLDLRYLSIPNSLTNIGDNVIEGCDNLFRIDFNGTKSEWKKINIGKENKKLQSLVICTTDGQIYPQKVNKNNVPKYVVLSKKSYVYDGKTKKPSVTVKDSAGKKIAASNYTVTYSSGRKNVGQYTVTIKFKGNYSGTVKKTFTIKPKATSISKVTAGKKAFTVKWKKQASQTTGYQIQYSTSSKFTAKTTKTVTVSKNKTTSKKVTKLKAKKKYYVRVRTYKTVKVNGKNTKIYSGWSKVKTVKTK